jgi:class 3 adenylate cyclase
MDVGNRKDLVFLFTDIQSSTELCEQNADAYLLLQEAHDEIIRNALAESGGHEVDTEGDAFMW